MSHLSYFEINLSKSISALDVILSLVDYGWSLDDHGQVSILPIGDDDLYNWTRMPKNPLKIVYQIINEKELLGEIIGIVILWQDSKIGGQLLVSGDDKISFILNINRKTLPNCQNFTDISWYLNKIIPPLSNKGNLELIEWSENV